MKIQISFKYKDKKYKYTIDENDLDMGHYAEMWDWWTSENNNEIHYPAKDEEYEMNFEVTADKKFITDTNGEEHAIICGEGLYINIYENVDADQYCDQIFAEDIEILYA